MAVITTAIAASVAAVSMAVGTGFQIAEGIDAANRAKRQEREQKATQKRSLTQEKFERERAKQKKRAADIQLEREAALQDPTRGQGGTGGVALGKPAGGKSVLGV